jgi:hypothetical protein
VTKVKGIMKNRAELLAVAFSIAFAGTQMGASTVASASAGAKRSSSPEAQLPKDLPTASSTPRARTSHFFPVYDEKGLLLTCVAPDIESNVNTDLFTDCTLAPGRTLNDVMHSFVGAMHYEENQRAQERAEWNKSHEDKSADASAQK